MSNEAGKDVAKDLAELKDLTGKRMQELLEAAFRLGVIEGLNRASVMIAESKLK